MNPTLYRLWITIVLGLAAFALGGCSLAFAQVQPTLAITAPLPVTTVPTSIPAATPTPVANQPETATVTETALPTLTPTRRPPTPRPTPRTTLAVAPGIYVTAIKIIPNPAVSNQAPAFKVTFLNTLAETQSVRWFVKIYQPDQPQSFGETAKQTSDIVVKTSNLQSPSNWQTIAMFQCDQYIARVFSINEDNQVTEFLKPDGTSPATGFALCPPTPTP